MNEQDTARPTTRSGGRLLVDALRINGTDRIFCVPGESYLAVLDALHDTPGIAVHVARNEGGASYMADAYGKLTGRPGVCMVTRGPGATNASGGVHVAFQDSTPMILFVGQVARRTRDREAFQEIDVTQMFAPIAKWVAEIDDPRRMPEYVNRAFATATSGRPGPVVLAIPEDMLVETADVADLPAAVRVATEPSADAVARCLAQLEHAERPLVVVGGSGWSEQARTDLERFAASWDLPVATSFRCQDYVDNDAAHYVGDLGISVSPALAERARNADVLFVIGARLGEMTTRGYTLLTAPEPAQRLVHVHVAAEELGRVYHPTVAVHAAPAAFVDALAATAPDRPVPWAEQTRAARREYLEWTTPVAVPGDVQIAELVRWLSNALPADAIVCNGAGNYTSWVHRFHRHRRFGTQLAPTNGAMGYGVPAAVAAKLVHPERTVVSIAGDGCFMMNGQELATAAQYGAAIIVIVVNNSMLGTIRMHQERNYPRRVVATELVNPDFSLLARAYGAHAERVTTTAEFAPAFERARAAGRSALIEIRLDPEVVSHTTTLSALRGGR